MTPNQLIILLRIDPSLPEVEMLDRDADDVAELRNKKLIERVHYVYYLTVKGKQLVQALQCLDQAFCSTHESNVPPPPVCDNHLGPRDKATSKLKNMFKIHGLDSVNDLTTSSNTNKFYPSYEKAKAQAERCLENKGTRVNSMVIFKAYAIIEHEKPPVVERLIEDM